MAEVASKTTVYRGASMHPTLKAPDTLQVVPYRRGKIQRGDVIVFSPPGRGHMVIHRVVSVTAKGIRTRGDNNSDIDPWNLSPDSIVGHVVRAQWGNRRRSIYGGLRGRLFSLGIRAIRLINSKVSSLLHPAYHRLARTGALRRWLSARVQTRILSFERSKGRELQLVLGRRVIGRLLHGRRKWVVRRPFRLFVDEESLSENPAKGPGVPPEAEQLSVVDEA